MFGVATAATIILIMDILGHAIPALRPHAKLVPDKERPTGITVSIYCSTQNVRFTPLDCMISNLLCLV